MAEKHNPDQSEISRRQFLKVSGGAAVGLGVGLADGWSAGETLVLASRTLVPLAQETNPLESYPNRGWEDVYRNQYGYDSSFTWVCSPNDTHECRLRAFVKNGIVLRSEQNYDSGNIADIYGNKATTAWNPRGCSKGFTMHRRVYGPYRLKYPLNPQGVERVGRRRIPVSLRQSPTQGHVQVQLKGHRHFPESLLG